MICLFGPSGSGKSFWFSKFKLHGYKRKNGEYYYFIKRDEFENKIEEGFFAEYTKIYNDYYDTCINNISDKSVHIVGRSGLLQLMQRDFHIISIYIDSTKDTRYQRMLLRGDVEETINSRINLDPSIFSGSKELADIILDNSKPYSEELFIQLEKDILHVFETHKF